MEEERVIVFKEAQFLKQLCPISVTEFGMVISTNGVLVNVFGPITVTDEGIIILVKEQFSKEPLIDENFIDLTLLSCE